MKVQLLSVFGTDKQIADYASMSYGKTEARSVDGLINILITNNHLSVFESASMQFRVRVPIYVQRQWMRHRSAYIEKSLRYTKPDKFYMPDDISNNRVLKEKVLELYKQTTTLYNQLVEEGINKEFARSILPLGTMTEFNWTVNLRQLMNFLNQRNHPKAQLEIRECAKKVEDFFAEYFPITYKYFQKQPNPYL